MPEQRTSRNEPLKAAVSLSEHAAQLSISRSRLYQLIRAGVLAPPCYFIRNRRPFFNEETQRINRAVLKSNLDIHGNYVVFYKREEHDRSVRRQPRGRTSSRPNNGEHAELVDGLKALGLSNVSSRDVERALRSLYPDASAPADSGALLRELFVLIRRSNGG